MKNIGSGNGAELATYVGEKGKPLITLVKSPQIDRVMNDWNRNRLTERLGLEYPIIQGPQDVSKIHAHPGGSHEHDRNP